MRNTVIPGMSEPVVIQMREGVWDHSDFPHPLVTLDYDSEENLLAISVVTGKKLSWHEECV
jgi:hypothetical protein